MVCVGASLHPHTRQRRLLSAAAIAKKGLLDALCKRGLCQWNGWPKAAPSALVWVWAEGMGWLGGRVAREVERDEVRGYGKGRRAGFKG